MNRHCRIVLVRPRDPNNIAACARAMANFGHSELIVVDPYEPVWQETRAAPGAEDVILNAKRVDTWQQAVEGCRILFGTSSFHQRPFEQATVELPSINRHLATYPASDTLALIFGSERSGLSNDELTRCHAILKIPTTPKTPSMNLGQAVAIVLYELRRVGWQPEKNEGVPAVQEQEDLLQSIAQLGESINYPAGFDNAARTGRIRKAFHGSQLTPALVRYLLSLFRLLNRKT